MIGMTPNKYEEVINEQYAYLDKVDFTPYINKNTNLYDLRRDIEDCYDGTELTNNDFLNGYLFSWLDLSELSDYIYDRYGVRYREVETVEYIRPESNYIK